MSKIDNFHYPTPKVWGVSFGVDPLMLGSSERRKFRLISVKLFSKNSNACDHNPPTLETDRQLRPTMAKPRYRGLRYSSRGKNITVNSKIKNTSPLLLTSVYNYFVHTILSNTLLTHDAELNSARYSC